MQNIANVVIDAGRKPIINHGDSASCNVDSTIEVPAVLFFTNPIVVALLSRLIVLLLYPPAP